MIPSSEYFRSVEPIWALWLASSVLLALLTRRALNALHWRKLRQLIVREEGAGYTLDYVLTLPFYGFVVCLVIESTLLLVVKMGTVYAAYSAARAAIVWNSATTSLLAGNQRDKMVQLAAVQAMTPFASGNPMHAAGTGLGNNQSVVGLADGPAYTRAYRAFVDNPIGSAAYMEAKYQYAQRSTHARVTSLLVGSPGAWNAPLTVKVSFDSPFTMPGVSRFLGSKVNGIWCRRIESEVTLPNEGPRIDAFSATPPNITRPLGILYVSE